MRILAAAFLLQGCAFFSDGAVVDYSRLFNFSPVFQVGGSMGGQNPYEADTGYKANRAWKGNTPWTETSIGETRFLNSPNGTIVCNNIGGMTFCN